MRQLVSLVFERVVTEEQANSGHEMNLEDLKVPSGAPPKSKGEVFRDRSCLLFEKVCSPVLPTLISFFKTWCSW